MIPHDDGQCKKTPWQIQPVSKNDRKLVQQFICAQWGSEKIIVHQTVFFPAQLPGFIVFEQDRIIGLATYQIQSNQCELITLDSLVSSRGLGTALINQVIQSARDAGCQRLFLTTTNDNLNALRFYQKRGFHFSAVFPNAVSKARETKPEIPMIGDFGILIRDEIELELEIK